MRVQLVTLAITAGAVVLAIAALGHLDALLPRAVGLAKLATYAMMAATGTAAAAMLPTATRQNGTG